MERFSLKRLALVILMGLGVSLAACKKPEEQNPAEKATEAVKDGLDMRKSEPLKDTGEDLKDAAHDTGEAVKDGAEDAKDKAQDAGE